MKYDCLYEFTETGLDTFRRAFTNQIPEVAINPTDRSMARRIEGTSAFEILPFATAGDMADAVIAACGIRKIPELIANEGLWAWLAFVMRDNLFPKDKDGNRRFGESVRWYPSAPSDWLKGQRHLVRMPVLLRFQLGEDADYLLCNAPSVLPEIREQMTSQQDMLHSGFQKVARRLYYDPKKKALKRGAGGKGRGSPRRLAAIRLQLDVTWNLFDLEADRLVAMLPREFDRFRAAV